MHALAREVAELRDAADGLRADAADARAARDDARRALLEETTRARSLERARVLDMRETRAAERRARVATETAWALRDKLALAAVETVIHIRGDEVRGDDETNKQKSVFREDEVEDEVEDEDEVHEFEVEDEDEVEAGRSKAPAGEYFRKAGARVFGGENGFLEEKTFEPFEAPTTPDGDERLGWRGPTPRAARVPRATAFSPM